MSVILALRISTAIPLLFKPILFDNKLWIDGGIIDNYPISQVNINTCLGIYITEHKSFTKINNMEDYLLCVFQSFMEGIEDKTINGYEKNTIVIKTQLKNAFSTNISNEDILQYIKLGYKYIDNYI